MFTRIESPRIGRSDIRVTRIALGIALVSLAGLLGGKLTLKIQLSSLNRKEQAESMHPKSGWVPLVPPIVKVPPYNGHIHIVTTVHKRPCERTMMGNWLEMLSVKNKENYAIARNYSFSWFTADVQRDMRGNWNKLAALQLVFDALEPNDNEWVLWVDSDALFVELGQDIPLEKYQGYHVVMWAGNDREMKEKFDPLAFNTGVMLFRNSMWTRQFFNDWAVYHQPEWMPGGALEPRLHTEIPNWRPGLPNQIAISHLLKSKPVEYREKLLCIDDYLHHLWPQSWREDMLGDQHGPLLVHWAGCQVCKPQHSKQDNINCTRSFLKAYAYADALFSKIIPFHGDPFDPDELDGILEKIY